MIDPRKELFVWGPIDGRPIYVSYFMIAIAHDLPRAYGHKLPEILFYFKDDQMTFICDYEGLRAVGKKHFNIHFMNEKNLRELEKSYAIAVTALERLQQGISGEHLEALSDTNLLKLFREWEKRYLTFWTIGLVPEVANFGGEALLKEHLRRRIKNNNDFIHAFEKLSAPERPSFYQQEELDLLRLKNSKGFQALLKEHAKKYFWLRNSYFETKELKTDYFRRALSEIPDAKAKITEIENLPKRIRSEKSRAIEKYRLGREIAKIAKQLSHSIWWQDDRKKHIFISNHYIDLFLKEISRRKMVAFRDLVFYWPTELAALIKSDGKVPSDELKRRKKFALIHYHKDTLDYRTGKEEKVKPFLSGKEEEGRDVLKGMVVSIGKGPVRGNVRILLTPRNVHRMKRGEILVAPMTSPDFIVAMRKASAIVTDHGGMTSHAAIVSRELGIPCIVGTKIATHVLKDNMKVEVDTKEGIVRRVRGGYGGKN